MTDIGRDVRSRVDAGSRAAAARLVCAVADRDHVATREVLCIADTSELARWLAHQIVADQWARHPRDYTERLRRKAQAEMDRCKRELLELAAKGDPL